MTIKKISLTLLTAGTLLASAATFAAPSNSVSSAPAAVTSMTAETPDAKSEAGMLGKRLEELNLTADQKTKVKAIFQKYQPQFADLKMKNMEVKKNMETLPVNGDVTALAKQAGENKTQMIEARYNMRKEIYNVLTAEQKKKVDEWRAQRTTEKAAKAATKAATKPAK